jgi:hypothetical protein
VHAGSQPVCDGKSIVLHAVSARCVVYLPEMTPKGAITGQSRHLFPDETQLQERCPAYCPSAEYGLTRVHIVKRGPALLGSVFELWVGVGRC